MLISRRLDDQSYSDIVAEALGRLPWICPVWTDHNSHDPGITILELMAWYKELQQYQMDRMTPALQLALLKLAGLEPLREQAAGCALEYPPDAPPRPFLSRLGNRQEIYFELAEPIPADRPRLESVTVRLGDKKLEVHGLLDGGTVIRPFAFAQQENTELCIGFSRISGQELRLWFSIDKPEGVPRNPPDAGTRPPRTLVWEAEGAGELHPLLDETLALSWSGYVTLPVPKNWEPGADGLYWLVLRQQEGGCEEQVRLAGVSAGRFHAVQQETRARSYAFRVPAKQGAEAVIASAQAIDAEMAVFLRDEKGWYQVDDYHDRLTKDGRSIFLDASGASLDGEDNLLAVCMDPLRVHDMLFDSKGRPGEQYYLNLGGAKALTGGFRLMCQTVLRDGAVRPAIWTCVEDLSVCSPRDRVFTYDPVRETVSFGDGEHGAVPAAGEGAVMVVDLALSLCAGGNLPENAGLVFLSDGMQADNSPGTGGQDRETLPESRGRLLKLLSRTDKCLSAEDYARSARETPGLRVAGAKALPGFDPTNPHMRQSACVTVAVLPAGEGPKPRADARFLAAVERQLDHRRTVCIRTRAIPARYVPFAMSMRLLAERGAAEKGVREALERFFAAREERIGAPARKEETEALIQAVPGVLQVSHLELRGLDQASYRTEAGDLEASRDTVFSLERVEIEMVRL